MKQYLLHASDMTFEDRHMELGEAMPDATHYHVVRKLCFRDDLPAPASPGSESAVPEDISSQGTSASESELGSAPA